MSSAEITNVTFRNKVEQNFAAWKFNFQNFPNVQVIVRKTTYNWCLPIGCIIFTAKMQHTDWPPDFTVQQLTIPIAIKGWHIASSQLDVEILISLAFVIYDLHRNGMWLANQNRKPINIDKQGGFYAKLNAKKKEWKSIIWYTQWVVEEEGVENWEVDAVCIYIKCIFKQQE